MGESNLKGIVLSQNPPQKHLNPLANISAEVLVKLGTPEAEAELTRRWTTGRFGADESE